jgi:hypothetical protein
MNPSDDADPGMSPSTPRNTLFASLWAVVAAFGTYFCMYGFRKPYTAGSYETLATLGGFDLKTLLVISQVGGYMVSKFLGIKFISELPPARRAVGILFLIGWAELALFGFALTPAPWGFIFLFLNGLPLGMVFGLVLGFLEGRRHTEALAAGLCASFILADGVMKSIGAALLNLGVSEHWMPAAAGACFFLPTLIFVGMLTRIAPPDSHDVAARSRRGTLNRHERWNLFAKYALGLVFLIIAYLLVTILRSIRADFQPQILKGLGVEYDAGLFTRVELWVGGAVLLVNGALVAITNNRSAFFASLGICIAGFFILAGSLLGLQIGLLSPVPFVVLCGLGLYFPYAAIHTTVFERLLAATKDKGTSSYLLQLADSFGYLGYIAVLVGNLILKWSVRGPTTADDAAFARFFIETCWVVSVLGLLFLMGATWFFLSKVKRPAVSPPALTPELLTASA